MERRSHEKEKYTAFAGRVHSAIVSVQYKDNGPGN
jgi:hypothetical protein